MKKVMLFLLTISLLLSVSVTVVANDEENLQALRDRYQQMEQQQKQIQKEIQSAKEQKQQQQSVQGKIQGQIRLTQHQIELLETSIDQLETEISTKRLEIQITEAEYNETLNLYKQRLRAMYMSGGRNTMIDMIFDSNNLTQVLTRTEMVRRISQHDQNLLDKLTTQKENLTEGKRQLDAILAQNLQDKSDLQGKKTDLDDQYGQVSYEIALILKTEAEYRKNAEQIQNELKKTQKEIDEVIAKINSAYDSYVGGTFTWPIPGFTNISSPFGNRSWGSWTEFHTGTDIAGSGINGSSIKAMGYGKVAVVQTNPSASGYGIYVVVDHGGGITTVYPHMSSVSVSLNTTVNAGDEIGKIGSTGRSTGPHMHIEVRVNGKPVNPMQYFN